MSTTLDDVRRHRHRGAHELVTKHCAPRSTHPSGYSVRINRDLLRSLPYPEFSEISHA
jgi:hypothetical protein